MSVPRETVARTAPFHKHRPDDLPITAGHGQRPESTSTQSGSLPANGGKACRGAVSGAA